VTIIEPRYTTVTVGPSGGVGRSWTQDFYINCEVERSGASTPNKAKVELYNLTMESIAYLETPGQVLHVQVGQGSPNTIFYGELRSKGISSQLKQPNRITTLEATDGQAIMQSGYFAGSYPAGTTRSQILVDVLAAGAIPRGYVHPLAERTYQASTAYAAPIWAVLDELYSGEPATWSIQGGKFQLTHDDIARPGNALVISAATGMIGSPERTDRGIKVATSQLGVASPGSLISVQSTLITGSYKVTKATARWDTELKWEDELVAMVIK